MIREAISMVVEGKDLDEASAKTVMTEIISGAATPSQIGAFMTASRMKGETEDELVGFALAMRESSARLSAPRNAIDLCGTGGDGAGTFNISTVASFIVSACGVPVAKHGNRSVSSKSGSADLLDALGIPFDLDPQSVQVVMDATGFGFMFAPVFHPSMRNVSGPRREVGIRSLFNLLGPLTNPARVSNQLLGVYDPSVAPKIARVLSRLGVQRAMVVSGCGTDEISNLGPTAVSEVREGRFRNYSLLPSELGMDVVEPADLSAGSPQDSARAALSVLRGERSPRYDAALMNAAAALYVSGTAFDLQDGLSMASRAVRTGMAMEKLRAVAERTRSAEESRQSSMPVDALRSRKIMPNALITRSPELTGFLVEEISSLRGGRDLMAVIEPGLLSSPSVLSVISLSRLADVASKGLSEATPHRRSPQSFADAISAPGLSVIGEYKPRSPSSAGATVPPDPETVTDAYTSAGISAMSVLVEDRFFGGGPALFSSIRERSRLPLLFKDFIVTEEQIALASRLGADAVLLIAKVLARDALDRFIQSSVRAGVEPLVELHDKEDIDKLSACRSIDSVHMVGLNSRDLRTLRTDISGLNTLRRLLPEDKLVIAESGIRTGADMLSLAGFDAVLVGTALMDAGDLLGKAKELVSAGRSVGS